MSKFDFTFCAPSFGSWWQNLWLRYYFKFVLPKINSAFIDGIQIDLSSFSPRVRNRILLGFEEAEKKLCQEFLTPDDSVLEIGAGIGLIALFCRKKIGIKNYIAVEANPMTMDIFKRNFHLNHQTPTIWNYALSERDGIVELHVEGDFWGHFISASCKGSRVNTIRVPSASLKTLLAKAGPEITTLIIDVEGAEQFINFAQIPKTIRKVIIELHPDQIGKEATTRILCGFMENGFRNAHTIENSFALIRNEPTATL